MTHLIDDLFYALMAFGIASVIALFADILVDTDAVFIGALAVGVVGVSAVIIRDLWRNRKQQEHR